MSKKYTDEVNTLILLSLLKKHGIKRVIASPGTTNVSFVASVQQDSFFEIYSAVDERVAAFMACGLAEETGEPVVLSCTGATASRNYIPGLTEAYYMHLPVLAVTSTQNTKRIGNYVAQVIDRSVQFNDMVKMSINLPTIYSNDEIEYAVTEVNMALLELNHGQSGPVHINLATTYSNNFTNDTLPNYRVIKRYNANDILPEIPKGRIGVFIGAHEKFSNEETQAIDLFCERHNAIVICDQTSNYRGKYRVLANILNQHNCSFESKTFDLVIHIGYVSGGYISFRTNQVWRVNADGKVRDLYRKLTCVFEMDELSFFNTYSTGDDSSDSFLVQCNIDAKKRMSDLKKKEIPFSNIWIAYKTANKIPDNSSLHLGILNSLRAWNFFETPNTVMCYANTGGFGIDGCLSSAIGDALINPNKQVYIVLGDLAFFYDLNSFVNKVPDNLHIMLINNGVGTEFKNYSHRCSYFGSDADLYMAAKSHNGYKSESLVKNLSANLGLEYYVASDKETYLQCMHKWLNSTKKSIIEIFTNDIDESNALKIMHGNKGFLVTVAKKLKVYGFLKKLLRR